jgi:medium-chain acyl-[acyl-carrier-protein] hydrolase
MLPKPSVQPEALVPVYAPPAARARLVCFPYAGAGAAIFRAWPGEVLGPVHVLAAQLPGREDRLSEPPFRRIAPLIDRIWSAALPYLDMPLAVFGHSMGALLGYEFARRAAAEGVTLTHLFVSGRRAPHITNGDEVLHALPDDQFLSKLKKLNGMPAELFAEPELMELIMLSLRADFEMCETHENSARPKLSCPITAFGGTDDPQVDRRSLNAWADCTSGRFHLRMFPGDHFFLRGARNALLRAMREDLDADLRRPEKESHPI